MPVGSFVTSLILHNASFCPLAFPSQMCSSAIIFMLREVLCHAVDVWRTAGF
jgi:hypothetical protein